jgi:glycosyltransferase involved in cell wall biosynthesis
MLRQNGYAIAQAHTNLLDNNVLDVLRPDVVLWQFQQTDAQIEAMRRYRKALKNTFMVYEIDDLFWRVPDSSVHKAGIAPDTKQRIEAAASICDAITVTTEYLAREMKRLTKNADVRVVPNEIPQWFINAALQGRRTANPTSDKPRIGWAGGVGHTGDLTILTAIMDLLGDEVQWVFMGWLPPHLLPANHVLQPGMPLPPNVEYHAGVPFESYPAALGALKLDIALAPLEDNAFNRCKSDLRVLEYGAAGFPVIASDVVTYRDCPHIRRVGWDAQAWADEIRALIADKGERDLHAENLHRWVSDARCMDKNLPERIKAYLPRHTDIFVPQASTKQAADSPFVTVGATAGRADAGHPAAGFRIGVRADQR